MNSGICMCVLLMTLWVSCIRRACCSVQHEESVPSLASRSAVPHVPTADGKGTTADGKGTTAATNFSELLAKIMSRKGSLRRNSMSKSRASGIHTNHQIEDRDYLGWMDFGRRSAEEYPS
ncbi:hypothetical protein ACEWY4_024530 [Coilia grayii]|uniref:Gastrin/cholecystokinin peptide hormone domain-containing protein n=1 Tax=Coilia grayii TaxID=363190 RepID=A0ABD1J0R1_9TELE